MVRLLPILCFLVAAAAGADDSAGEIVAVPGMQGLGDARYHKFPSSTRDRTYHVFVRLPEGYGESGLSYPTVYLLDGGLLYPMLGAYYGYLRASEEVPDLILVAISYGTNDWQAGNNRGHDFTAPSEERDHWGGAEAFRAFLGDELIPRMESNYRSDPARRIIFGHSLGGQFALFAAQTKPSLFWGHIASNPALHRNLPFFLEFHGPEIAGVIDARVFVGDGSDDAPVFVEPRQVWVEHWTSVEDPPWRLRVETLDGHSHFSAPPASFRGGLRWLFSDAGD